MQWKSVNILEAVNTLQNQGFSSAEVDKVTKQIAVNTLQNQCFSSGPDTKGCQDEAVNTLQNQGFSSFLVMLE